MYITLILLKMKVDGWMDGHNVRNLHSKCPETLGIGEHVK